MTKLEVFLFVLLVFNVLVSTSPGEFVDNWRAWLRLFGL